MTKPVFLKPEEIEALAEIVAEREERARDENPEIAAMWLNIWREIKRSRDTHAAIGRVR
jgi:hypothetical protein